MSCDCQWCKLSEKIHSIKDKTECIEARDLIDYLANELIMTSEDNNYNEVVMNGSWPTSVEILTRALENAKSIKRQREREEAQSNTDRANANGDLLDSRT